MAGKLNDVRIVTLKKDFGRYKAGDHAMHKSVAEKLKKRAGADATVKPAKEEVEKLVQKVKELKANQKATETKK